MSRAKSTQKSVAMQRASGRQWVLKPQDLAVALKLVTLKGRWLPYAKLGEVMHLSRFEAHAAVQRLMAARLVADINGQPRPILATLRSFILHGAPYVYPAVRGETTRGFPTMYGVAPLKDIMVASEPPPVWPHPEGVARGPGLLPLYENLPLAARADPALYELLALFDALRAGQARERKLATQCLKERLSDEGPQEEAGMNTQDALVVGNNLTVSQEALRSLSKRFHIKKLSLFGSAARGELRPNSDIDLLVEFEPEVAPSFWAATELQEELSRLFGGRTVDIVPPEVLRNPYRRKTIERDLKVLIDEAA